MDEDDYLSCPDCGGPLYVDIRAHVFGMPLRRNGTYDFKHDDAETDMVDSEVAYCGECETEFPIDYLLSMARVEVPDA